MYKNRDNNKSKKQKVKSPEFKTEQDENYEFIEGYASWGFPYGITRDETDDLTDDEDLPF